MLDVMIFELEIACVRRGTRSHVLGGIVFLGEGRPGYFVGTLIRINHILLNVLNLIYFLHCL